MKSSTVPKTHLFCEEDLCLYEIQNIFTACALWLENNMQDQVATYDLMVRDMPKNRNFMLFGGLEEIIEGIKKWHYSDEDVSYLEKYGLATPKLAEYLRNFKFTGDICAMPEGTIFFPGEPIVRITAPILEGNLITMFLINAVSSNTIFMSKVVRSVIAAGGTKVAAGGGLRAQSFESAMKGSRAGYLVGAISGLPSFYRKYNITPPGVSINAYHAVIKSFPSEIEAMRAAAKLFPNNSRPMVDTYDFEQGIENVITVSRELKEEGGSIAAITVDSGDLFERAVYTRKKFDEAGFSNIKIFLASNLNEKKIQELKRKGVPADLFLAVTELSTSTDDPKLEIVYKLSEIKNGDDIRPVAKFAKGKISYPGRKQVFRQIKNNQFEKDVIGLEKEKLGIPLLQKMVENGRLIYHLPHLDEIQSYIKSRIKCLPPELLDIDEQHEYEVEISERLEELTEEVRQRHAKNSSSGQALVTQ